jgi:hypothetical protein
MNWLYGFMSQNANSKMEFTPHNASMFGVDPVLKSDVWGTSHFLLLDAPEQLRRAHFLGTIL